MLWWCEDNERANIFFLHLIFCETNSPFRRHNHYFLCRPTTPKRLAHHPGATGQAITASRWQVSGLWICWDTLIILITESHVLTWSERFIICLTRKCCVEQYVISVHVRTDKLCYHYNGRFLWLHPTIVNQYPSTNSELWIPWMIFLATRCKPHNIVGVDSYEVMGCQGNRCWSCHIITPVPSLVKLNTSTFPNSTSRGWRCHHCVP